MAQRTKQTARKSTGGAAPRRLLAAEGVASRAASSHAVGSGGPKPWGGRRPQPSVHCAAREPVSAEKIVAEAPPRVLVESGAVAGPGGRRGAVVDVDPGACQASMCSFDDGSTTTVEKDQLGAVKSAPATDRGSIAGTMRTADAKRGDFVRSAPGTDWSGIGGTMRMAAAKRKYLLTDKDGQKLPRTPVGSDVRGGSNVQVAEVLAAALQKHGGHIFVGLLAILADEEARKEARQEAEIERQREEIERLQQEVERLRPGTAAGQSLEGGGVKRGAGAAALEQKGASTWTSFNFWVEENKDRIRRENPGIINDYCAFARGCLSGRVPMLAGC